MHLSLRRTELLKHPKSEDGPIHFVDGTPVSEVTETKYLSTQVTPEHTTKKAV